MSAAPEELSIDKDAVSRSKPKLTDRPNKQIDPQIIKTKKPQTLRKRANRREIKVKNQSIQKMVCRLHNLKPVMIHFKWCDASKNQDTACSCSRLRISLLQFISPMARGREPGCHCWRCQRSLAGPATAGSGRAAPGPSGPLVVMSGYTEKRLEVATTTSCRAMTDQCIAFWGLLLFFCSWACEESV